MTSRPDVERAEAHFEGAEYAQLLKLASTMWPVAGKDLPIGMAEVCRFARISAYQMGNLAEMELWDARCIAASVLTAEPHTAALLLLPRYFAILRLAETAEPDAVHALAASARQVLDEQMRLLDDDSNRRPSSRLVRRIHHERRGYSFFVERCFVEAEASYLLALGLTTDGSRSRLKVRGGLALCQYLADHSDDAEINRLLAEMLDVQRLALAGPFPDVEEAARINGAVMADRSVDGWVPFEMP